LRIEVQIPVVVGGYHIPRASDPDVPALEVLAAALSTGESSRLHQRLVRREHLAIAAGGVTETLEQPGLFIVYAAYLPDRDAARVQAVLSEEIERVRDKPIGADELDKAKNQLAAAFVFGLQTVDGIAQALGRAQYVEGDWKRFVAGATRYLAVTAADVQRVARKYLVDSNLTRVTLAQPGPPPPPPGGKP
jgi:zinc protease